MEKMRLLSLFILVCTLSLISCLSVAQQRVNLSLFPGYHVINTDQISQDDDVKKTNLTFGGKTSVRTQLNKNTIDFSLGYTYGKKLVLEEINTIGILRNSNYYLSYHSLPLEALYVHNIDSSTELLAGINIVAQYRIIDFGNRDINNDRLLSFGMGLSAQIRKTFRTFSNEKGEIFGSLSARWTEYFIHDSNGRDLDDFTLRHLTLSPQIGFSWNLGKN